MNGFPLWATVLALTFVAQAGCNSSPPRPVSAGGDVSGAVEVSVTLAAPPTATPPGPPPDLTAEQTAMGFIRALDEGRFDDSWLWASAFARERVSKGEWVDSMRRARENLGAVFGRRILSREFIHKPASAGVRPYAVIRIDTEFRLRPDSVETVTAMYDENAGWRIAAYYIK